MPRGTLGNLYLISNKFAKALNRFLSPYNDQQANSKAGYVGDKLVHLRGRATKTAGTLGEDADGNTNNKFTFADFGLKPGAGGPDSVDVYIRPTGGGAWEELMAGIDFYCSFSNGLYADTGVAGQVTDDKMPTDTGSYIIINQSVPATTEIHVKQY